MTISRTISLRSAVLAVIVAAGLSVVLGYKAGRGDAENMEQTREAFRKMFNDLRVVAPAPDKIADGLAGINVARAGAAGHPVDLIDVLSRPNGTFSATLQNTSNECRYVVDGTVSDGVLAVNPQLTEHCGNKERSVTAVLIPRHQRRSDSECKQTDDRDRVVCFATVSIWNRQLALADIK